MYFLAIQHAQLGSPKSRVAFPVNAMTRLPSAMLDCSASHKSKSAPEYHLNDPSPLPTSCVALEQRAISSKQMPNHFFQRCSHGGP